MSKTETRDKILTAGAGLIHKNGFHNTGLNDILRVAGVPKGSFYFYFRSKEDFGLELIDHYVSQIKAMHRDNGVADAVEPDKRLFLMFETLMGYMKQNEYQNGCPIGNLVQEMSDISEVFRVRLEQVFADVNKFIEKCLRDGKAEGVFSFDADEAELADFIFNSYQGAIMRAKLVKSDKPFRAFFDNIRRLVY